MVTNYSLQAFNSNDYNNEDTQYIEKRKNQVESSTWMDSIFNKNDGYLTPLTFNPYRNRGKLDIQSETERTMVRLSAILIQAKKKSQEVLEGYQLADVEYQFEETAVGKKLSKQEPTYYKYNTIAFPSQIYVDAQKAMENPFSYMRIILEEFGYSYLPNNAMQNNACIYLCYKILSIAGKYPKYDDYESLGDPILVFKIANPSEKDLLISLIETIKKDTSHIVTKVRQTINFLDAIKEGKHIGKNFKYAEYEQFVTHDKIRSRSVEGYMEILPPPIFDAQIYFNSVENKIINTEKWIHLKHLSSGERQLLFMMSTLIYHVMNIKSVSSKIESYRNINLVLDEIEICFHPEYQRKMVYWLVSTIKRLHLTNHCKFNIILTTHSPFILSDMAPRNILYLEEGKPCEVKLETPFAANVNEILRDSFFLKEGFMGELAKEKVLSLIAYLRRGHTEHGLWTKGSAEAFIDMIGEPMLREKLRNLLNMWLYETYSNHR